MSVRFRSLFRPSIDPRGRLALPAKWHKAMRENGHDRLFVLPSLLDEPEKKHLIAYTEPAYVEFEKGIEALDSSEDGVEEVKDAIFGSVHELDLDKVNRITLTKGLREDLQLEGEGEVVLVGRVRTFQIWASPAYDSRPRFSPDAARLYANLKKKVPFEI